MKLFNATPARSMLQQKLDRDHQEWNPSAPAGFPEDSHAPGEPGPKQMTFALSSAPHGTVGSFHSGE